MKGGIKVKAQPTSVVEKPIEVKTITSEPTVRAKKVNNQNKTEVQNNAIPTENQAKNTAKASESLKKTLDIVNSVDLSQPIAPSFVKSYSVYETNPSPILEVALMSLSGVVRLNDGVRSVNYPISEEIPPNMIKSFEYSVSQNQATIELEDTTFIEMENLLLRMEGARQNFNDCALRITFGWQEPNNSVRLPNKVKKKLFTKTYSEFLIASGETTYSNTSIKLTLKLLTSARLHPLTETFKPYHILGSYPIVRFGIAKLLDKFFSDTNEVFKSMQNNATVQDKERLVLAIKRNLSLFDKFGYKEGDVTKYVNENIDKLKKIHSESVKIVEKLKPILNDDKNSITKILSEKILDYTTEEAIKTKTFEENKQSFDFWTQAIQQNSNIIDPLTIFAKDVKVNAWSALKFLMNCYILQREAFVEDSILKKEDQLDIPSICVLNFVSEDEIIGYNPSQIQKVASDKKKTEKEIEELTSAIAISSITVGKTTSWGQLLENVAAKVRVSDTKGSDNTVFNSESFPLIIKNYTVFLDDKETINDDLNKGDSDRTYRIFSEIAKSYVQSIAEEKKKLSEIKDENKNRDEISRISQRVAKWEKAKETIEEKILPKIRKVIDLTRDRKGRSINYIIISRDDWGTALSNQNWKESVMNTYVNRPKSQTEIKNRGFFNQNSRNMSLNNLPDVISFNPIEFNYYDTVRSQINAMFIKDSVNMVEKVTDDDNARAIASIMKIEKSEINDSLKKKKQTANKKNKTIEEVTDEESASKEDENRIKLQEVQKILSNNYPVVMPPLSNSYMTTAPETPYARSLDMKRNILNMRRRMMYSMNGMKAELEIIGEPYFEFFSLQKLIVYKHYNPDGTLSYFSGMYRVNNIKHKISGGKFTTVLELINEMRDVNAENMLNDLFIEPVQMVVESVKKVNK